MGAIKTCEIRTSRCEAFDTDGSFIDYNAETKVNGKTSCCRCADVVLRNGHDSVTDFVYPGAKTLFPISPAMEEHPMTAPATPTTRDRVLNALPITDGTDIWTTAKTVSEVTDIRYSTVTENLRKLAAEMRAEYRKNGRVTEWRSTATPDAAPDADPAGDAEFVEMFPAVDGWAELSESDPAGDAPDVEMGPINRDSISATRIDSLMDSGVTQTPDAPVESATDATDATDPDDDTTDDDDVTSVAYADDAEPTGNLADDLANADVVDVRDVAYIPPAPDSARAPDQDDADGPETTVVVAPAPGASVDDVIGFMSAVRPVSAPPADETTVAKTSSCTKCGEPIAKYGRSWRHDGATDADHKATTAKARAKTVRADRPVKRSTCTARNCGQPIVKDGRSWRHEVSLPEESDHKATTRRQSEPRVPGEPTERVAPVRDGIARPWARGELKATITAFMQSTPDGTYAASNLTNALNEKRAEDGPIAQSGSVDFALKTLHSEGVIRLTQDAPRRYAAA